MQRERVVTKDGSDTILIPELGVTYHSVHGAIQESKIVYIQAGLEAAIRNTETTKHLNIFEIGLGTGLNALLTEITASQHSIAVFYECVEAFPLSIEEVKQLNYCLLLNAPHKQPFFELLHTCEWEKTIALSGIFQLHKRHCSLQQWQPSCLYHLVYFDAFAPSAQPELWTKEVFEKIYKSMAKGGVLVTYCSKGDVRRNLMAVGFIVRKLPGPPGKREIVRAEKK